jgi:hypothetical protein
MAPTIRIDEDVWTWLKGLAKPFEDTPNTVLRRVAGLDEAPKPAFKLSEPRTKLPQKQRREAHLHEMTNAERGVGRRVTGEHLNRKYRLGARHALYHKDGTFYERLSSFPGVLCDSAGFVRYDSEKQFDGDSRLNIGQKVNVRGGLFSHPRYERFPRE